MGRSLRNLHNNSGAGEDNGISNANTADIKNAQAKASKYKGMNENQLMGELMSKMNNAKDSGDFNSAELDSFYYQMAPYLSNEQRNKMRSLINMLKR